MRLIELAEFEVWTRDRDLIRSPDGRCFEFASPAHESVWQWPDFDNEVYNPPLLARYVADNVEAAMLGQPGGAYLFPAGGTWNRQSFVSEDDPVRNVVLEKCGFEFEFAGAVYFEAEEFDSLVAVIFARGFLFPDFTDGGDDLYLYPAHGDLYMWFDDDEMVGAFSRSTETLKQFDAHLERSDWHARCRHMMYLADEEEPGSE